MNKHLKTFDLLEIQSEFQTRKEKNMSSTPIK